MRLIYNRKCDECESMDIRYDESKGEVFCLHCGLILEDRYALISIPRLWEMMKAEEKKERIQMIEKNASMSA